MNRQAYLDLQEKHCKEISDFPIAYAFNESQLEEALNKLGATDISECVTIMGGGDIVKKTDAKKFVGMLKRHVKEIHEFLLSSIENAEAAFLYEMDNHEYAINYDGDGDVLGCFGMDEDDLSEMGLELAYGLARRRHMKNAQEWGMI